MPQLWSAPQSADPAPIGGLRASTTPRFYPPSSTCHPQVHEMLDGAALGGLVDVVWRGVCELQQQHAATGAALNSRFQTEATSSRHIPCTAHRDTCCVCFRHQYIAFLLIRTPCPRRRRMT